MSGHSKWSTIKHKKGALDAKRGKIFTKVLKEITVAAKDGGSDLTGNPRLRLALEKAKVNNVPKDNIEKAIKRGTGELEGLNYEEYIYEGYGPAGIAILVEVLTDNKNRTGGEIRSLFTKSGNSLAEAGSVAWNFERKGMMTIKDVTEDEIMEKAMELGIEDIEPSDDHVILYCDVAHLYTAQKTLAENYSTEAELTMKPKNLVQVTDVADAKKLFELIDKLEDHDDVQKVYANFDIDEKMISELDS